MSLQYRINIVEVEAPERFDITQAAMITQKLDEGAEAGWEFVQIVPIVGRSAYMIIERRHRPGASLA